MTTRAVPSPTLMSLTVDCRSQPGSPGSAKEVLPETRYAEVLIESLDGAVLARGPAVPAFASGLCDSLLSHEAQEDEDWSAPAPPMAVRKLLSRYRAESMFVPAVTNEWRCFYVSEHATSCEEKLLMMVAYVFTADRVIWKSKWRLGVSADQSPDFAGGVSKLFEGAPLAEVARLQDPEAPTYERALEEAGVFP